MRPTRRMLLLAAVVTAFTTFSAPSAAGAAPVSPEHHRHLVVSGLQGSTGSTIGPDGALYIAEGVAGRISRVDPWTGQRTTFASGLPKQIIGVGGPMDVAFIGHTAYVLVTLVSPDVGGTDVDGIYRVDGPHTFTVISDIGAWSMAHPPKPAFVVPTGVQFALQPYRGAFLVTDGHHNRVLRVTLDGNISKRIAFPDIVPTGLAVRGTTVFVAQAGPVPHLPADGRVVSLEPGSHQATPVAAGAPLLVDVEFGRDGTLYALSQGHFTPGHDPGTPADPGTGALERVNHDGTMTPIATELDRPTSLEFIGGTAFVVTLSGEVWAIDCVTHGHHVHR